MNTQELLYKNATLWAISTSTWTGSDRLMAEDLNKTVEEIPDIFKLGSKYLIPTETRKNLLVPRNQIAALMQRVGRPFLDVMRGAWIVPNANLLLAKEGMTKIQERQDAIVEDLINNLEEIKSDMLNDYPVLEGAQWPTPHQIRRKFKIKYLVFQLQGAEVSETDPEDLINAKKQFQEELKESYEELRQEIMREAHGAIVETCGEIEKKILETGDKITEGTLKKPRKVIEDYENIAAIFDVDEIKAEVAKIKKVLDNAEARTLREDWDVAQGFANALKTLGESVGDLSGYNKWGRKKRVVKIGDGLKKKAA